MSLESALARVREYFRENYSDVELSDDYDLVANDLLTSLQMMGLVVLLEKLRGKPIALEDIDIEKLRTISLIKQNYLSVLA